MENNVQKILQMKVIPFTLKKANKFITEYHKHSKRVVGCRFCLAVEIDGKIEVASMEVKGTGARNG